MNKKIHSRTDQIHLIWINLPTHAQVLQTKITSPCVCVSCVFSSCLSVCENAAAVLHLHRCYQMKSSLSSSLSFSSFLSLPSFPAGKWASWACKWKINLPVRVENYCRIWQQVSMVAQLFAVIWRNNFGVEGVCLYLFTLLRLWLGVLVAGRQCLLLLFWN